MRFIVDKFEVTILTIIALLKRCAIPSLSISCIAILVASCQPKNKHEIDLADKQISLNVYRFEQDLFSNNVLNTVKVQALRKQYGKFFDLYCHRMIQLPVQSDELLAEQLQQYISDKYIREVYDESQKKYKQIDGIKHDLTEVFKHYGHYFPKKNIPDLVTYIAPFNYNVMTMDSILGIGLDMYLGEDYNYYSTLELPQYLIRSFRQEYIVRDCIKGWFQSEWNVPANANDMLSNMIYQGKLLYFSQALAPQMHDTIRLGYSAAQLQWCMDNEQKVWQFFIEQKLLYNKTPGTFMKFINDGNSTNGFPQEAPAKLGGFIGWQIVQSYMNANPNQSLEQLLLVDNAQQVLSESKYKPKK